MKKRRSFSAEFKARVALEALSGAHTLAELSAKHNVHPNMIAQWKRRAQENLPELFSKKDDRNEAARDAEVKELHAKIGKLTVENDFLSKAFGR
jgi:transposase